MTRLDARRVAAWRRLQATTASIERDIDTALMTEWEVPLGWFDVLAALQRRGGSARPVELAAELPVVRSSLSRRLDRLEEEGWIARRRDGGRDHRAVTIDLTRRGRALWRDMNVTYRRAVQERFAGRLDDGDVESLHQLINRLE